MISKILVIIMIIITIIIIINPSGLEIPGGNWHGVFSHLTVKLKCTQK